MATEIRMPQLGLTMTEGVIGAWLKQEGDTVKKGDPIVQITTDKLNSEIESEVDGVLRVICAQEGEEIPVQGLVAIVGTADEEITIDTDTPKEEATSNVEEKEEIIPQIQEKPKGGRIKASPLAKKIASKKGIDLAKITGTGHGGRIVQKDVLAYEENVVESQTQEIPEASEAPAYIPKEDADIIKPLTNMRKVIGKRMTESKHNAPHVTITTEVNVDKTIALRSKLNEKNTEVRLSYTDILVKMIATALRNIPMMNTSIEEDHIIIHDKINIGVAVALEEGLIVPVVKDADRKGFKAISKEVKDLAARAKENNLLGDELTGGTFTISNLGNYDVDAFTPIINLPESAILGVGRIVKKPIVNENDEIVPASMMTLSLSFDHRIADGALAAELLKMIKGYLEDPDQMYL
ncbi:pyruvate dehydrogenase E2 component (dihydrolipoamide acetyltransferase) [Natronincola peptidivorans]|uniref:Dihydrolipoamide acetyltransferase component of pyruvate dehydrogenase complex n=1 Tax=Natronincola peptidivorans TaxID=426128 RepID=A0A1I0BPZ5_9FIRM|nr:dihydrolipoamide acetyltransferase family protein [Natronincola peptidivorans]SET08349.1 pyruvate dehydrogenase E2 component (dihydrolipoamide acetyltransferase) [Natronincola peptidivorans]